MVALAKQAMSHRPDLAAARESAAAAAASADEPGLRFVPTLGASAQARLADQTIAADRYYDTTLTLNLSWTLWDAGVRGADARSRQASADVAELNMRALQRKVEADVKSAVVALVWARQAMEAAGQSVEAARRSAEETSVLYKQGLARAIELVDANLSRYSAEVSLAGAQLSLRQAELDLRAALGLFPIDGVQ
jgi:outer membrane protein TolC